jgi:solute:Na+ symporter, SSS family
MGDVFTPLDLVIFFTALVGVMVVGLIAGRKEDTSEDYFLAGRKLPWWGVAGSIFGSNVSANHMVGMMGIGFSVGFAQSHFELGAIFGLLALCYGFLPVYRKLNVYTLSEYLGRRYDDRSRVAYAVIMVIIMAVVQMVPGLYIGSRTICVLMGGDALVEVTEPAADAPTGPAAAAATTAAEDGLPDAEADPTARPAGAAGTTRRNVNFNYYVAFVIALAVVSASYTIFGGLKAVVWTDVMQSLLLLAAGIGVALLTFYKIGGWGEMMALDREYAEQAGQAAKMSLYRPPSDPDLPWTGVLTGLIAMHFFYWGTNQFIVQRAHGARSDAQARMGIVAAGFLKLLIPFFAIAGGVAAFYLFQRELPDQRVAPDAAFSELVKLVIPAGFGIIGLIAAGVIGAILSSIDSMMNSAATIVTVDVYKRYINPNASERRMILVGRLSIVVFVVLLPASARAQEGQVAGTVRDSTGAVLPGVLVEVTSPALIEKVAHTWGEADRAMAFHSRGIEHHIQRGVQTSVFKGNLHSRAQRVLPVGKNQSFISVSRGCHPF